MLSPLALLELAPNPVQVLELFTSGFGHSPEGLLYRAMSCFGARRKACVCMCVRV